MIAAVVERCAGIDVRKKFLKVCVMVGPLAEEPRFAIRQIDCSDAGYRKLREWLKAEQVTHGVMESTGPYWVPVFNILEPEVKVVWANPAEVKNRKGHKTDAADAWWLAHLLRHSMIHPSFHSREGDPGVTGVDAAAQEVDWAGGARSAIAYKSNWSTAM